MPARGAARKRKRSPVPLSPSLAGLGERIRAVRLEAGLSQSRLGRPHFTRAYVSALELGKIRPSMKALEFLAQRLGKHVTFFLEDAAEVRRREELVQGIRRVKELLARGEVRAALELVEHLAPD